MSLRYHLPKKMSDFHHAYLIYGGKDDLFCVLEDFFGVSGMAHPDLFFSKSKTLSIDEARNIRINQSRKPVLGPKTIFIIEAESITTEAQNSLLKVFEDPAPSTLFFLILPPRTDILPTLRSRLNLIKAEEEAGDEIDSVKFLSVSLPKRLEMISGLLEDKDKSKARIFLDHLERSIAKENLQRKPELTDTRKALHEIIHFKKVIQEPGSSVKLVLEYLALRLPVVV